MGISTPDKTDAARGGGAHGVDGEGTDNAAPTAVLSPLGPSEVARERRRRR